jgi:hypothetical protein
MQYRQRLRRARRGGETATLMTFSVGFCLALD